MELIKLITPFSRKTNDVSTVFDNTKAAISAEHAYQKSRFGCLKTETQLLKEFFANVQDTIEVKNLDGQFSAIIEVNTDIIDFMPKIIDKLTKELGYKVIVINDDVEFHNKKTKETHNINVGGTTYIVLFWNKEAVQEVRQLYISDENN